MVFGQTLFDAPIKSQRSRIEGAVNSGVEKWFVANGPVLWR